MFDVRHENIEVEHRHFGVALFRGACDKVSLREGGGDGLCKVW